MIIRSSLLLALTGATALTSTHAFAQTASVLSPEVEEIFVVAARREQQVFKIAKSVSVLDEDTFEKRQYVFVLDALQSLPGVAINQTGTFGGVATVGIRGNATDQTVVLIDGVQVNDPSSPGGGFDFATLDPNGIERVEVLRGPQAVLYGSDAIGGVINIITKSGKRGFGGSAFAEYGAFDSRRFGANVQGGSSAITYNLSGSYFNTDGISAADVDDGNTEDDGYENFTLRAKVDAKLSDGLSLQLTSSYSDTDNEFDGFALQDDGSFGLGDTDDTSKSEEFNIAGRVFLDALDGRFSNQFSAEYSRIERNNFSGGAFSFGAEGERLNFDYLGNFTVDENWVVTAGAQYEDVKADSIDPEGISIASVFGLVSYEDDNGITFSGGVRLDDHETFGTTFNGEANASYVFTEHGTQIKAAWSEGFKAPSIFQLTFACCGFDANPDLEPERSNAWEVGVRQPLFGGKGAFEVNYFNQRTTDLIIFTFTDGFQNIDRARSEGLEFIFNSELTETLSVTANYTLTDAEDRSTGDRLIRRPKHLAFGSLTWDPIERLSLTGTVTYNGQEADTAGTVPDWVRVDLRANYKLTDVFEVYGRIDNLFDENYQQVLGYGTPGISAFGGVRARF